MAESVDLQNLREEQFCYLTTTGRVTGNPHEIEIWFGIQNNGIYLMSGGGSKADWVKNLLKNSNVTVRIGKHTIRGIARLVKDQQEEMSTRNMLAYKYNERESDGSLDEWARTALVVAIDVESSL
jgi:deazaflavin-dependent oxidoreductase (nitroreductase family)